MAWHCSARSNEALVENLWKHGLITDERVKAAFLAVDRAHYSPEDPYRDSPQHIGGATSVATISAPHMHATAMKHLAPFLVPRADNPAPRALDIGSGSGILTHVMAELAGDKGTVVGVEHIPELVDLAKQNMSRSARGRELLESGRVKFVRDDGRKGWAEEAAIEAVTAGSVDEEERNGGDKAAGLWDAIHVGACASSVPKPLLDQLRSPGRMFIPVEDAADGDQHVWEIDKDADGVVTEKKLFGVRYVPLTDAP